MLRFRLWGILLVVLLLAVPVVAPRVESWSEPVYTKPWSEPEETKEEVGDLPKEPSDGSVITGPEAKATESPKAGVQISDSPEIDDFLLNFENLYGTWHIWTPSTTATVHAPGDGEYIGHEFVLGAEQGIIVIDKDGTYSMSHATWDKGEVVEGSWRLSYPREINGEVLQAIVLLDGITGVNWAVAPSSNGKIRLLWAMEWADGSATWIFDSELYRK